MKPSVLAALAALLVVILVVGGTLFTVQQTEQGIVLYFGEPVRVVSKPGLHAKVPFVENVVLLDNRILDLETPQQEVLASDNQRILVDAFVRYHINDPLRFYQTVGTVASANNQLASVMNSALRRVLGDSTLPQIVKDNRAALMVQIRDQVNNEASHVGLSIDDVKIRRADLPRELSEKVFARMQSERAKEAAEYRARGAEQAQSIRANADREAVIVRANAQRKADELRGEGDASRNQVFADAFGKDPGFFAFYRSMQAYTQTFKAGDTRFVISPTSDFFRFFNDPRGGGAPASAGVAPEPSSGG